MVCRELLKQLEMKQKSRHENLFGISLGTLGASLLKNMSSGKRVNKGVARASKGNIGA